MRLLYKRIWCPKLVKIPSSFFSCFWTRLFFSLTTQLLQFFNQNLLLCHKLCKTMFIVRCIFQQVENSFFINCVAGIVKPFFVFIWDPLFPIETCQKIVFSLFNGVFKFCNLGLFGAHGVGFQTWVDSSGEHPSCLVDIDIRITVLYYCSIKIYNFRLQLLFKFVKMA